MPNATADLDPSVRAALSHAALGASEDRAQLAELVRGYLAKTDTTEKVRDGAATDAASVRQRWQRLAVEQGWPGLALSEEHGGLGLGFADLATVIGECGRALAFPELVTTSVLAASLLTSDHADSTDLLPRVADGSCLVAVVGGHSAEGLPTADGQEAPTGWALTGTFGAVVDAAAAHLLLVPARTGDGPALFAVEVDSDGVQVRAVPTLDLTRNQALVTLANARARLVLPAGHFDAAWRKARLRTTVAIAAEQVAGAERCFDLTLRYLAEREQFGRAIGSFQAVKHRCGDLFIELQAARSATDFAIWAADTDDACLPLAASIAKAAAGDAFRLIAAETVQLHGGIGFTWEHNAHLYFRRAASDQVLLGDASWHRGRIASLLALPGTAAPPARLEPATVS